MKPFFLLVLLLIAFPLAAQEQIPIRVCTYNILNFGDNEDSSRITALRTVLGAIRPDILVVQEVNDGDGLLALHYVLVGSFPFSMSVGTDGPNTDKEIFCSDRVQLVDKVQHHTALRDIEQWILAVKESTDTIHLFMCHLTEGDANADVESRLQEALVIRSAMESIPSHHHSILTGDLNVYSSSEPAYNQLTYIGALPTLFADPINRPGNWHDNESFADVHTQSPRVRSFDSGATGGLDDRFDFVLLSPSLMDGEYVTGSYTAYGNDGQHFNDSINAMPNENVSNEMAQALHDASDHLPVYLDLVFQKQASGVEREPAWMKKQMDLSMRKSY